MHSDLTTDAKHPAHVLKIPLATVVYYNEPIITLLLEDTTETTDNERYTTMDGEMTSNEPRLPDDTYRCTDHRTCPVESVVSCPDMYTCHEETVSPDHGW